MRGVFQEKKNQNSGSIICKRNHSFENEINEIWTLDLSHAKGEKKQFTNIQIMFNHQQEIGYSFTKKLICLVPINAVVKRISEIITFLLYLYEIPRASVCFCSHFSLPGLMVSLHKGVSIDYQKITASLRPSR